MGQQQLLLLVLATIIVGIATVVGIQAFSQNNVKSNADAMMNDAIRIASDAQAWTQKSKPFGGPTNYGPDGFAEVTFELLGYSAVGSDTDNDDTNDTFTYSTLNGDFEITDATAGNLVITGTNQTLKNQVKVTVVGLTNNDITGEIVELGTLSN